MGDGGQTNISFTEDARTPQSSEKKTPQGLIGEFEFLWEQSRHAFRQERTWQRTKALALSQLVCLGQHTVTGLLCTSGRQFRDWTAGYRLLAQSRVDMDSLFGVVRRAVLERGEPGEPFVVAMDDTMLRKSGCRIPGARYRRDPMSPPFHPNLVRAQRMVQVSAICPLAEGAARAIPIDFTHAPSARKPRKNSPPEQWEEYGRMKPLLNLSRQGAARLQHVRQALDDQDASDRSLWVAVDGSYTNGNVLKRLPERTVLIGRIRGDAKLYNPPKVLVLRCRGRRRVYGERLPTPEELRRDDSVPWSKIRIFAAGRYHDCRVKTLSPVRWRAAGGDHVLRLIVIAPLGYRLSKNSKVMYRKPAFLVCTDPQLDVQQVVQAYFRRWDIEVNFRDEKQLIGVGEAQVRSKASAQAAPALAVASYAMLLLASLKAFGPAGFSDSIPSPKWRGKLKPKRASTMALIRHLRHELWGRSLGLTNFSGFVSKQTADAKPQKFIPSLASAVLYAAG